MRAASGELPFVSVFGNDYATPDSTCIRDYIHVADLADAHVKALEYLESGGASTHLNLGNGLGFSVFEVIEAARNVTGKQIEINIEPRRPGDPDQLVADAAKAFQVLGWKPVHTDLDAIIRSAWAWKQSHPNGYSA